MPCPFVDASLSLPVATEMASTFAPTITAPDGSVTVPLSVARSTCAINGWMVSQAKSARGYSRFPWDLIVSSFSGFENRPRNCECRPGAGPGPDVFTFPSRDVWGEVRLCRHRVTDSGQEM